MVRVDPFTESEDPLFYSSDDAFFDPEGYTQAELDALIDTVTQELEL